MPKYFVHVAFEEGAKQKIHGPFDTPIEAHQFGTPFAEEGLDVEVRVGPDEAICDFCSAPEVGWSYDARDFGVVEPAVGWGSRGGWAACEPCHNFIEANDKKGLRERSVKNYYAFHPEMAVVPKDFVRKSVMMMHEIFFQVRIGGAQKGVRKDL
jgi:hypothetical protein